MNKFKLGIDVGGTKIAYGLLDNDNKIIYRNQTLTPLDITPEQFTRKIYAEIDALLDQSGCSPSNVTGIAMGMPSYVDYTNGLVVTSGSIHNIKNYPARKVLKERFHDIPVIIDGDTNMAALAEHRYGAGKGYAHIVYAALSTGLGTGFIINNSLFRGSYGGAGESGHMIITPGKGLTDGCGNQGCFMSYACGSYVVKHARNAIQQGISTSLSTMVDDLSQLTARHLAEAYKHGDSLAEKLMYQMIHYISLHIYNLFIAFNINCFVCGGGLTNMGDFFLETIQKHVNDLNKQDHQPVYIKKAALGGDNGLIGCAVSLENERSQL